MDTKRGTFSVSITIASVLFCAAVFAQSKPPTTSAAIGASNPVAATAASQAGTIGLVGGEVRIDSAGQPSRRAVVGDRVSEGDTITTGKDSEAHLSMQDSGFIALRPNTQFKIVNYKAEGGADDKGVFQLLVGGFRSVTGWIGKYNRNAYKVQTPTATIGIRGTDHETHYIPEGSDEGEAGTYDKVYAGGTSIQTSAGRTDVLPNQAGFVSLRHGQRPRLLAGIPRFFRPGPNEAVINQKHREIQQQIQQRREERRKVVAEKRVAFDAARTDLKAQRQQNMSAMEERRAAAQAQRADTQRQSAALQHEGMAVRERQKALQEQRSALQADHARGQVPTAEQREQRKALRHEAAETMRQRDAIQDAHKTLEAKNKAAVEQRQNAFVEQQKHVQEQRKDVQEKGQDLRHERASAHEEIKGLHEKEQKRFRDERKKDRMNGASSEQGDVK